MDGTGGDGRGRMKGAEKLWLAAPYLPLVAGLLLLDNAWVATFGFHGAILLTLFVHRARWSPGVLLRGGGWAWLPLFTLLTLAGGAVLVWIAGGYPGYDRHLSAAIRGLGVPESALIPLAVYICLVNPVLEEAFWRGLFFEGHRRLVLADVAYGGIHVIILMPFMYAHQAVIGAVFLVGLGYVWRRLVLWRKGNALSLAWHVVADMTILLVAGRVVRG